MEERGLGGREGAFALLPCSRTSPGYCWLGLRSSAFVRLERGEEESPAFVWLQHSWGLILRFLPPSQKGCGARQTKQRRGNKPAAGLNEEVSGAGDEAGGSRSAVSWRCAEHSEREGRSSPSWQQSKELVQGSLLCPEAQALVPKPTPSTSPELHPLRPASGRPAGLCSHMGALFPTGCARAGSC